MLRRAFMRGEKLTVLDATTLYNTVDLRKYVSLLRQEGMSIADEWHKNNSTGKRFKRYWMNKEVAAVGEQQTTDASVKC